MPRKYRMGKREGLVVETRQRILEAAHELVCETGFHSASVDEIASRAGVVRATIYHHFQSKLGLLGALFDDAGERAGMDRLIALREEPDPLIKLERGLEEVCRFWSAEHTLFRNMMGLAASDNEAKEVVDKRDKNWQVGVTSLADELNEAGHLRPGCSKEDASGGLRLLFAFSTFDYLYYHCGMSPEQAARILKQLAAAFVEGVDRAGGG